MAVTVTRDQPRPRRHASVALPLALAPASASILVPSNGQNNREGLTPIHFQDCFIADSPTRPPLSRQLRLPIWTCRLWTNVLATISTSAGTFTLLHCHMRTRPIATHFRAPAAPTMSRTVNADRLPRRRRPSACPKDSRSTCWILVFLFTPADGA